jgi:uncharacterized protein YgiM (DUF1202 family)
MNPSIVCRVETEGGNLNLRSQPSEEGRVIASIPNGTAVLIINRTTTGWYLVQTDTGAQGYVYGEYVVCPGNPTLPNPITPAPQPIPATVRTSDQFGRLYVHTSPLITSEVVDILPNGMRVEVLGEYGSFYQIRYDGKTGYVANAYIELDM